MKIATVAGLSALGMLVTSLSVYSLAPTAGATPVGPTVPEVRNACGTVLAKTYFDAYGDGLREPVRRSIAAGRSQVVVAGCEAHVCLLQTALGMLADDLDLWLVVDACGSRNAENRQAALQRLRDAGARCVTTEMVGFEWVRHAGHPAFKTLQALVR